MQMHRQILGTRRGTQVDHRDGDGLNNRRLNLREATNQQNQQNRRHGAASKSSKFKGVYWHKLAGKWNARIRAGEVGPDGRSKHIHLGLFTSERAAAKAYDDAARVYFGQWACLNLE